jgi:hypothetical protein
MQLAESDADRRVSHPISTIFIWSSAEMTESEGDFGRYLEIG